MHIYLITNTINDKKYIGKTIKPVEERWKQHAASAKSGRKEYLYKAMRKYGIESFSIIELKKCNSEDELNVYEKFYIRHYKTCEEGYNLTIGGDGASAGNKYAKGHKVTPTHREKLRHGRAKHRREELYKQLSISESELEKGRILYRLLQGYTGKRRFADFQSDLRLRGYNGTEANKHIGRYLKPVVKDNPIDLKGKSPRQYIKERLS